jgi:hypothetical protein
MQNSVETALKTVNLCLIVNNFVYDGFGQQTGGGERRAVQMHALKQGAPLIIDEGHVLKIHQNFPGGVIGPGGAPAGFKLGYIAIGQATVNV